MMLRRFFLALLASLLLAATAAAGDDYGGYGGAFLQMSVTPRAVGMGNAYTAVSDDIAGIFFNPGAVAQLQRLTIGGAYRDMSLQRSLQQFAVLFPVRGEAAIAFSGEMASTGGVIGRDERGVDTGELDNLDGVIAIAFSRRFSRYLTLGGDIRYYYQKLESVSAYSAGFDVGGMIHLDRESILPLDGPIDLVRFGAVVRNLAAKYPWNTGEYWSQRGELGTDVTDKVPFVVKAGASVLLLKERLLLAVDGEKHEEFSPKLYAGGEFKIVPQLALRAGVAAGEPAFGVGFTLPIKTVLAKVDIAVEQARNVGGWESIFGFSVGL